MIFLLSIVTAFTILLIAYAVYMHLWVKELEKLALETKCEVFLLKKEQMFIK